MLFPGNKCVHEIELVETLNGDMRLRWVSEFGRWNVSDRLQCAADKPQPSVTHSSQQHPQSLSEK